MGPSPIEPTPATKADANSPRTWSAQVEQGAASSFADLFAAGNTLGEHPPATELPQPNIPGYDLLRELGRGGMGVVYLAREKALNRLVALKVLSGGAAGSAQDLARFRAEADAVAALHHPNIVQIFTIGETHGLPFVSLEYIDGGTLGQLLLGQPMEPREAARLLVTLAQTIHYAHRQGIIHRDLKPANILVSSTTEADAGTSSESTKLRLTGARLKIADFGLAKRLDDVSGQTRTGIILGTPEYMAPEQAAGRSKIIGPGADIYALGAILYEMLTGRPPHRGLLPMDTLLQVLHEEPVRPRRLISSLPRDLETICLKCLEKEPNRRYLTAQDLAEDLRRFLQDQPISARPIGLPERTWRWCRKNRLAAGGLAAAAGFFLLGSVLSIGFGLSALDQARRASDAQAEELKAKEKAERRYELARSTVDRLLPMTAQMRAAQDVTRGRLIAMEMGLNLYLALLAEAEDDEMRAKVHDTELQLGLIHTALFEPIYALSYLENAELGIAAAARRQPEDTELRYQEASSLFNCGLALRALGRYDDAAARVERAIELWEQLLRDHPDTPAVKRTLYTAYLARCSLSLDQGDEVLAQHMLEKVSAFGTGPLSEWEDGPYLQYEESRQHSMRAEVELFLGRAAAARDHCRQALQLNPGGEKSATIFEGRGWQEANISVVMARASFRTGHFTEAAEALRRALELCDVASFSQLVRLKQQHIRVIALQQLGRLQSLESPELAEESLQKAASVAAELLDVAPQALFVRVVQASIANDRAALAHGRSADQAAHCAEAALALTSTSDADPMARFERQRWKLLTNENTPDHVRERLQWLPLCDLDIADLAAMAMEASHDEMTTALQTQVTAARKALELADSPRRQMELAMLLAVPGSTDRAQQVAAWIESSRFAEAAMRAYPDDWTFKVRYLIALAPQGESARTAGKVLWDQLPQSVRASWLADCLRKSYQDD